MARRRCAICTAWIFALLSGTVSAQPSDCSQSQATGFTEPAATVEVAAREPGIVAKVLVEVGDRVKAGDILAELDKTLMLAQLESARARASATGRLEVAKAKLAHASRRSEEIAKLERAHAARPLELISAKAEMAVARAELQAAEDDLHIAELGAESVSARLSLLDVRAPFDGVVNEVHRDVSELVGAAGEARIVTLYKLDRLHADFFVPAGCIGDVSRGSMIAVRLERLDKLLEARVRNLGVEIDAPTGMRRISIEIDNPDYVYLGGERLVLALPVGELER